MIGRRKEMHQLDDYMGLYLRTFADRIWSGRPEPERLLLSLLCHWKVVGNNSVIKAQDDEERLALDRKGERGIFVECKFRNR